ncbi:hypothetical protein JVU11DRAFT_3968 [Chiua virens]|nr:hypothetical protein JVU11DRAFT_3968 [Chiua virens]
MNNPHLKAQPNFSLQDYVDARLIFMVEGKTDEEATALLKEVWHFNHYRAIAAWDQQRRTEQEELEQACRQKELDHAAHKQEHQLALQEERKKHKNKFLPISNRPLPSHSLFIPLQHTLNKLNKGEYVPLYYFSNKGMHEAKEKTPNLDDDVLTLTHTDGGPVW